jgi:hypothetical protein
MKTSLVFCVLTLLASAAPSVAHHSYINIDRTVVVAVEATVLDFQWRNPHVYIRVAVDENGERVEWEIETGGTPILIHSGWSQDSIQIGDVINVRLHPERDTDRRYALLESLTTTDGTVLRRGIKESQATETTTDMNGVWKSRLDPQAPYEVMSALYEDFIAIPLTDAGQTSIDTYDHDRDNPTAICGGYGLMAGLTSPHYLNQIAILDDRVIIRDEWFDAERIVYTDGREHPVDGERTRLGHSIGHWEGDTLVVDTRLFAEHISSYGTGLASGLQKHIVERYTLNGDGRSLKVEVLLEDPEYLAENFSGSVTWDYTPDFDFYRYDCDPAVATRFWSRGD